MEIISEYSSTGASGSATHRKEIREHLSPPWIVTDMHTFIWETTKFSSMVRKVLDLSILQGVFVLPVRKVLNALPLIKPGGNLFNCVSAETLI